MTKQKPGAYEWRRQLQRAHNANRAVCLALKRMVEELEEAGSGTDRFFVAAAASSLADNLGAIGEEDLEKARMENKQARKALKQMVDAGQMRGSLALLVARAANGLNENLDALQELERIKKISA